MTTMRDRSQIEQIVFQAIDRVNQVLLDESAVPKEAGTILLGDGAVLDSMGFVNLIVALEEQLSSVAGVSVNVVEELNVADNDAPKPATVNDFVGFLSDLVRRKSEE
jgi:acyl carrier protein